MAWKRFPHPWPLCWGSTSLYQWCQYGIKFSLSWKLRLTPFGWHVFNSFAHLSTFSEFRIGVYKCAKLCQRFQIFLFKVCHKGFNWRYLYSTVYRTDCATELWTTLRWRHNGCDSVSNHQPHDRLLNRLFRCTSKKTSKSRVTGLCVGNSPRTGEFPAQMASNAENVTIWWRHHEKIQVRIRHAMGWTPSVH